MKKLIIILVVLLVSISATAQAIRVAAAANLRNVLDEIRAEYIKQNPDAKVDITYGAAGALTQQILNGAGFDFFMAADRDFPLKLQEEGATIGTVQTYAYGKLVMWSGSVDVQKGLEILSAAQVKRISIANPEIATYGTRAVEMLKRKGLFDSLTAKIVYADNIQQAAHFAFTGNAEVGFIALSLALSPEMLAAGKYFVIPEADYTPIEQACVLLKKTKHNPQAAHFMKFILDPKRKAIWEKWGYKKL
jgi:molybdate transport system substrate-binding protein